jgi:hypothetical protein
MYKKNSNYPEPLYDVEKIGERSKNINKGGKVSGTRNIKTRGNYSFGKDPENILFERPVKYVCSCGFETMSCFKKRSCDKCGNEMKNIGE